MNPHDLSKDPLTQLKAVINNTSSKYLTDFFRKLQVNDIGPALCLLFLWTRYLFDTRKHSSPHLKWKSMCLFISFLWGLLVERVERSYNSVSNGLIVKDYPEWLKSLKERTLFVTDSDLLKHWSNIYELQLWRFAVMQPLYDFGAIHCSQWIDG